MTGPGTSRTSAGRRPLVRSMGMPAVAVLLLSIAFALLVAPSASAAHRETPAHRSPSAATDTAGPGAPASATAPSRAPAAKTRPMMLASTGLDIGVPVIIGLGVLVLGTVMVGWVFLATGRAGEPNPPGRPGG
jgi:hypothetical protein